ncbi:MAG: type VII secretion protein EssA [Thomasclavelia sp.]|nr:type VII secretion protein EssA [Thomasclavelia sp.]
MKKLKIITITLIMMLLGGLQFSPIFAVGELDLNPDSLNEKDNNYESLTDRNKIDLFTDDFQKEYKTKEEEKTKIEKQTNKQLFSNTKDKKTSKETKKLFQTQNKMTVTGSTYSESFDWTKTIPFLVVGLSVVTFVLTKLYYKFKKRGKVDEDDLKYNG